MLQLEPHQALCKMLQVKHACRSALEMIVITEAVCKDMSGVITADPSIVSFPCETDDSGKASVCIQRLKNGQNMVLFK